MGNQRVGIFPPKSEILFVLSLALIWCRNFQDRTIPVGGDTWPCFWRKEGIRTRYTSARQYVKPYEKKTRELKSRTITWQSADFHTTFFRRSNQVGADATVGRLSNNCFPKQLEIFLKKVAERSRDSGRSHATVGRLSNNVFSTFQAIRNFFEKSRWTVTRQWSEVTRPSADCQTTFLDVSSDLGKFWKKSLNGHATVVEVTRPSADCQTTFLDVSSNLGKFHATVVGGHATIGRLSNNVFWTFQAIWENFEKSRWTVKREWSEVTRPCADCQTTFFRRSKQFGRMLKKVAERSRESGRRSRDRRPTVKQRFWTFQAIWKKILDVSSNLGNFFKKSLNGHATVVGGHATVGRLSSNVFGRFKQFGKILKKVAERSRDSGRRSRDHRPTVKQRFFDVSSNLGKCWKKSLNGHARVVGGHATVGRLSNNVFGRFKQFGKIFWTFQAIWEIF